MQANIVLLEAARSTIPGVIMLGLGMVFVGLICIIVLCKLMGWVFGLFGKKQAQPAPVASAPVPVASAAPVAGEDRGQLVAAVCAAVAEELGTEVSAIRVISFKKI